MRLETRSTCQTTPWQGIAKSEASRFLPKAVEGSSDWQVTSLKEIEQVSLSFFVDGYWLGIIYIIEMQDIQSKERLSRVQSAK